MVSSPRPKRHAVQTARRDNPIEYLPTNGKGNRSSCRYYFFCVTNGVTGVSKWNISPELGIAIVAGFPAWDTDAMSLLSGTVRFFQDLVSFGGTSRMRKAGGLYSGLASDHAALSERILRYQTELTATQKEIERQVETARRWLRMSVRILKYSKEHGMEPVLSPALAEFVEQHGSSSIVRTPSAPVDAEPSTPTVAGLGAGAATSAGTWGAAQMLLQSSAAGAAGAKSVILARATAVAAAVSASPAIVAIVGGATALAVSAKISHTRANSLSEVCREMEILRAKKEAELAELRSQVERLQTLEGHLRGENLKLSKTLNWVRLSLFPLGPISHFLRLAALATKGAYYRKTESSVVEQLDQALVSFTAAFQRQPYVFIPAAPLAA